VSTVFLGVCSHGPGITGRAERADPALRDEFYRNFARMRDAMESARPDALVVIAAEHFANFFMNNMPAFAMGMAEYCEGPIEDENWLAILRIRIPGNAALSRRLISSMLHHVDLAYAEEWKFDHGIVSDTDEETYRDGGQGGFEIRTFVAAAAAGSGASGRVWFYAPIPIFAVGCTIGVMDVGNAAHPGKSD